MLFIIECYSPNEIFNEIGYSVVIHYPANIG